MTPSMKAATERQIQMDQPLREYFAELQADAARYLKGLKSVQSLINESTGVGGLHLNGDFAPWSELQTGGRFEEWLVDFDAAIAKEQT